MQGTKLWRENKNENTFIYSSSFVKYIVEGNFT